MPITQELDELFTASELPNLNNYKQLNNTNKEIGKQNN